MMIEGKQCNRCGELKPLADFYRRAQREGGYRYVCKACDNQRNTHRARLASALLSAVRRGELEVRPAA